MELDCIISGRVARMYLGDISLEQENQEVVLSIMLQVE